MPLPAPKGSRNLLAASETLTGALLGMGVIGYFLDRKLDTAPYLLLTGLLLGAVVGLYGLWRAMQKSEEDSE